MSASKHFDKIVWTLTALMLVITILFMNGGALGIEVMARTMGYENRLFDNTRVHTIDIVMDNWDEFIASATTEEYYTATLVIDGEAYKNVAIRGKGNTSLSTVSSLGSERYSFKVEFDHYDSSLTYHGLDKLSLNNLIQDSTMMKDYLTYTMMGELGAYAPLCSFAYITVNGEDWGLYLAVEGVENSFLERNYGSDYGELYKPDSMDFGGGRGNGMDFSMDDFMSESSELFGSEKRGFSGAADSSLPDDFNAAGLAAAGSERGDFGGNMGGGENLGGIDTGMGSSDVKLQYIDDDFDSYSNIWDGAKTDITDADKARLISALKTLSGDNAADAVDVEAVIKYFVVHNYVCNGDSYTGSMIHNYYLYEENGKLSMLPWDYNLAFGTFQGGDAQSTVNTPIDSPVSGGSMEDRPMISWIFENEEYTELYHTYFKEFLETVDVESIIDAAYTLIAPYVEKDPTAFYTYEEFESGVEVLREFCALRSESISLQLENGATTEDMGYVNASHITLSDMGSMNMDSTDMSGGKDSFNGVKESFGGLMANAPSDMPGEMPADTTVDMSAGMPSGFGGGDMPEGIGGEMPGDIGSTDTSEAADGEFSEGFADEVTVETPEQTGDASKDTASAEKTQDGEMPQNDTAQRPSKDNAQISNGDDSFGIQTGSGSNNTTLIWLGISALVLCIGLVVAKVYKH